MITTTLKINGMTCMHCVMHVKKALGSLDGVKNLEVGVGNATIESEKPLDEKALKHIVEDAGYEVVSVG